MSGYRSTIVGGGDFGKGFMHKGPSIVGKGLWAVPEDMVRQAYEAGYVGGQTDARFGYPFGAGSSSRPGFQYGQPSFDFPPPPAPPSPPRREGGKAVGKRPRPPTTSPPRREAADFEPENKKRRMGTPPRESLTVPELAPGYPAFDVPPLGAVEREEFVTALRDFLVHTLTKAEWELLVS